jgi:hypothetical protein
MKAITPLRLLSLPLLALAVLPSCKKNVGARMDPQWWKLEADRVELVQEIKLQKLRLGEEDVLREHAALKSRTSKNEALLAELQGNAAALRSEVANMAAAAAAERENWIASTRAAAVGRKFATFIGSGGRVYEDVTITRVTDVGVEFRHSDGSGRLLATEVSPEFHDDFGLDTIAALAALERERETARAYEAYIEDRMVVVNAERRKDEQEAAERETDRIVATARARSEAYSASLAAKESSNPLRESPRAFGSRGDTVWYPGYSYRYSRYPRNYYYYSGGGSPVRNCNYARAFAVEVSGGGCGYTPRVTPVLSSPRSSYNNATFNP